MYKKVVAIGSVHAGIASYVVDSHTSHHEMVFNAEIVTSHAGI